MHGYKHGHGALALPDGLDQLEARLVDVLSDLSGYLPNGLVFPEGGYLTGFQCGRYYAIARTWLHEAERAGCVLTHTLLVGLEDVGLLDDVLALRALHRRPISADETGPYFGALEYSPTPTERVQIPDDRARAAVAALLSQNSTALWVGPQPVDEVRLMWGLMSPEERRTFSFCTMCLQPRSVLGKDFDFQCVPMEAIGSFCGRTDGTIWWWMSGCPMEAWASDPWVSDLARRGAEALAPLREWCAGWGVPYPGVRRSQRLRSLVRLESGAKERLAAARGFADLVESTWPTLDSRHPLADYTLCSLLGTQHQAGPGRPLFDLVDFFKRPLVRKRMAEDASFRAEAMRVKDDVISAVGHMARPTELEELRHIVDSI